MEIIQTRKDVISDDLSWVGIGLFLHVGIGQVFFDFTDIKGGVHETYSTNFFKWSVDQIRIAV